MKAIKKKYKSTLKEQKSQKLQKCQNRQMSLLLAPMPTSIGHSSKHLCATCSLFCWSASHFALYLKTLWHQKSLIQLLNEHFLKQGWHKMQSKCDMKFKRLKWTKVFHVLRIFKIFNCYKLLSSK